jgi:hypothetical protein
MSYACAEKYSSEVRDRSDYRERIVSALQLIDPQKVKELVKAKSEENKAMKQAQKEAKEAKKQAKQAQKEAKEAEKAQKLREKEIQREMKILEMYRQKEAKAEERAHKKREKEIQKDLKWLEKMQDAHIKSAEKEEKGLKRTKQEPWTDWYDDVEDDTPVETQIVRVKRINAEGKPVGKGTIGGDYLLDQDNNDVYCANTYNVVGKWSQIEERIVFKR